MPPVKILYCIESMEVAGAEWVMLSLIEHLDKKKFEPIVCCLTEKGKLAGRLEDKGIPVLALGKDPNRDLAVIPKLMKVIREHQIEIVHTHCWPANAWGRIAAWLARVPIIIATEHSVHTWKSRPHLIMDEWLAKITDKVVCVSDAVYQFYQREAKIPSKKLIRIHNGIDLAPFNGSRDGGLKRREWGIDPKRLVLMVVGRLIPDKGHSFLLKSLAEIRQKMPLVLALIVGDGPAQNELEKMQRDLQLQGHVRFLGQREDVASLLKMADLLVLPSLREGLPLVALEAMAASKPVIVTDVGGNREAVVDGITGVVIPSGDAAALTSSILTLGTDTARLASMGHEGRKRVESYFSLEGMVRQNEEVYEALIREKGRQ